MKTSSPVITRLPSTNLDRKTTVKMSRRQRNTQSSARLLLTENLRGIMD